MSLSIARAIPLAVALLGVGPLAYAQGPRWEIEGYGGAVLGRLTTEGSQTLPPAGAPLVTSTPLNPTREVPSWFFGDGANLLNAVAEQYDASSISPLDPLFASADGDPTFAGGVRVRRRLSARLSAEFGVDLLGKTDVAPTGLDDLVGQTRASYATAFRELLATGPFTNVVVGTDGGITDNRTQEFAATAALSGDLTGGGSLVPYVTVGAGVTAGSGSVTVSLNGQYRFSILGEVPVRELDSVTVRFERRTAFVAVFGGGVRRDLSEKWGLRIDARVYLGPDSTRVTVTTESENVRGTPAGSIESAGSPAIQFSNDPSTGRRSSLSAPPLQDFRVFSGGVQIRPLLTFGISRRF